jgi:hypothetical protein
MYTSLHLLASALINYSETDYYKESNKQMNEFQGTLKAFCQTLKKRKLDSKLGIEIKEPKDYKMTDVLSIAKMIYDENERSVNTRSCMRAIRKCFQATARHEGTLKNLLNFIPGDIYGSVISGGFTIILAVSFNNAI